MVTNYFFYTPEQWQYFNERIGKRVGFTYETIHGNVIQYRTITSVTDADIDGYFAVISVF